MCPTVYKRSDSFDNVLGKHEAKLKSELFKLAQNVKWWIDWMECEILQAALRMTYTGALLFEGVAHSTAEHWPHAEAFSSRVNASSTPRSFSRNASSTSAQQTAISPY